MVMLPRQFATSVLTTAALPMIGICKHLKDSSAKFMSYGLGAIENL